MHQASPRKSFKPAILFARVKDALISMRRAAPEAAKPLTVRRSIALETMEPRLLLSGDLSYSATAGHNLTLSASGNVLTMFDTAANAVVGSVALSTAGDVNVMIERGSSLGLVNADTVHIDLDTFAALNSFVNAYGHKLTLTFDGGDQRLQQDKVDLKGTIGAVGYSLTVQSNSEIDSSGTIAVDGDLTLNSNSTASNDPEISQGLFANANSLILLTGAHLSATGSLTLESDSTVDVDSTGTSLGIDFSLITSFSGAKIDIDSGSVLSAASVSLTSFVHDTLKANASNNALKLVVVAGNADPEVLIHGGSQVSATAGAVAVLARSDVTIDASTKPSTNSDSKVDAAVVSTTFGSGATLAVSGATTNVWATGGISLTASSKLVATDVADANVGGTAGAAVAVSVITGDTTADVDGATVHGSSVNLAASTDRSITTTAKSSPGGSSASGGGGNKSETTLADNKADTPDTGNGSTSIKVAGAISVSTDTGTTSAYVHGGTLFAGSGAATIVASSTDVVVLSADGEFTGDTSSSTNGVGVGVAIGVGVRNDLAYISGASDITAGSLKVQVLAPSPSSFSATATSGVGSATNVSVAGSLAVNVVVFDHFAYIDKNAAVTLHGNPDLTVEAHSDLSNTTKALAADGAGDPGKVGVGLSVAFNYGEDNTAAYVDDFAGLTGAKGLTLDAESKNKFDTEAVNGAKGGTAVTPVIAITVANNNSHATLGQGGLLSIGADGFSANSALTDGVQTKATGDTKSSNTGVGISVALTIVNDSSMATTGRDLLVAGGGASALMSAVVSGSESTAKASVKGAKDENTDSSGKQVDGKTNDQKGFADTTAKDKAGSKGGTAQGNQSATSPSAATSDGGVSVAGAVAVDIENASSIASVPDGRHITSGGALTVQSKANADAHATADGSATTTDSGTGVGVAVSLNVANVTNRAFVGDTAVVSAGGLAVQALVADREIDAPAVEVNVIDTAKDTIFVGLDAGLTSGDQVAYFNNGGSSIDGLSSDITGVTTSYYVHVNEDGTVKFYDTKVHAEDGGDVGHVDIGPGTGSGSEQWLGKFVTVSNVGAPNFITPIKFNPNGKITELNLGDDSLLRTNDSVKYVANGTAIGGLTDGTTYYVIDLTEGHYQLAASRDDADSGKAMVLTGIGNANQKAVDQSDSVIAHATSGAGGGKIGVAGSVAVNVVNNDTEAVVGRTPGVGSAPFSSTASVNITGGGNVVISAASDETNVTKALPSDGGGKGGKVGVGASVAVEVANNTVNAEVTNGVVWSGTAGSFSASATSADWALTHGENGAAGSVGVGVGAAVAVVHDTTTAYVGTGASTINATGNVSITASHTGTFETTTSAEAAGSSVGVGASISVAVVIENISAELARNISTSGGAFTLLSTSTVSSVAQATATVKGEDENDSKQNSGSGKSGADGQADHQVNDNSTTKSANGNGAALPSAQDKASSGQSSTSSEGSKDSSGVGIAAAVAVNVVKAQNTTRITNGGDVTAQGAVTIQAQAEYDTNARGIGAAIAMDNNTNIAAGVGLNVVLDSSNKAYVNAGSVIQGNGIAIRAITPSGKTDDFVAWGAAAAGGKGKLAIAGSIGINVVESFSTEASARSGSQLKSSGGIDVKATANLDPQALAAAGAFSKGTAIGATILVEVVNASTTASIGGNADAAGAISVEAETHLVPTKLDLPFIPDSAKPSATSVAVAGAATSGDAAVAGSFIVNVFHLNADAHIGASSQINQLSIGAGGYARTAGQTVTVAAVNETAITSIAGSLAVSTSGTGVGIGLDVELLFKNTDAYIGDSALVGAGGAINVTADSFETMLSIAATAGVGDSAGIAASIAIADIQALTEAHIGHNAIVNAGGTVDVKATSTFQTTMIAGSVGIGGTAGIGVSNATLVHSATTQAYVDHDSQVIGAGTVTLKAKAKEDIVSIVAGIAIGGDVGVAGSAAVNVLNETTTADVGHGAQVTVTGSGHDLAVSASDDTSIISVAGSLAASGTVAAGIGADVGTFAKHTNAFIGSGVVANVGGNITVDANTTESLISVSAGVAVGEVGIAANAGVHLFNLETRAFIGDDPNAATFSGAGNVHANGSVVLSANDITDINEIVGVLAAGEVGVGAAVGVNVFNKDTESFIGAGAKVSADGNNAIGLAVNTGRIDIGSVGAPTFDAGTPSGVGIQSSDSGTLSSATSGDRSSLRSQGQVNTPQIAPMNLHGSGSENVQDPSLSGRRTAGLNQSPGFHGVAVTATNRDEIRTLTISLAGGIVGVAVSAGVDIDNASTKAYVGDNANVNTGQSVLIGAGDDFYHLAVAGSIAGGLVGVAPAVGVNVATNTTDAYIGTGATVIAGDDIAVEATGHENLVMIGMGIAAGFVGVGGAVDVLSINNHTHASIGDSATVYAQGDVFVSATDDTHILELSGALGAGFVGVGASVGVMLLGNDTQASIGASAHVDALGNGVGISSVLDGSIITGSPDTFGNGVAHGVIVQAQSSEDVLHIVAAAAAGFVGVSGAVGVTLINGNTDAVIGDSAVINGLHQGGASGAQSVYVNASDDATVRTFMIGIAGGFVGASGAVDVGTLNSDVKAEIGTGAVVTAKRDVKVNAVALKSVTGVDISGAGGFVGVGGAVSVWSIGTQLKKDYTDNDGTNAGAVNTVDHGFKTGAVSTGADTIDLGSTQGFATGSKVVYHSNGAPIASGADGSNYFVRNLNNGTVELYDTSAHARDLAHTTGRLNITSAGNDAQALTGANASADGDAASQADSGTGMVTNSKNNGSGGGGIDNFGGTNSNTDTNANSSQGRLKAATTSASSTVNAKAPKSSTISALENQSPVPPGTSAIIHAGTTITANTGDISVKANEIDAISIIAGQVSGGAFGTGAAIAVVTIADNVTAAAGGRQGRGRGGFQRARQRHDDRRQRGRGRPWRRGGGGQRQQPDAGQPDQRRLGAQCLRAVDHGRFDAHLRLEDRPGRRRRRRGRRVVHAPGCQRRHHRLDRRQRPDRSGRRQRRLGHRLVAFDDRRNGQDLVDQLRLRSGGQRVLRDRRRELQRDGLDRQRRRRQLDRCGQRHRGQRAHQGRRADAWRERQLRPVVNGHARHRDRGGRDPGLGRQQRLNHGRGFRAHARDRHRCTRRGERCFRPCADDLGRRRRRVGCRDHRHGQAQYQGHRWQQHQAGGGIVGGERHLHGEQCRNDHGGRPQRRRDHGFGRGGDRQHRRHDRGFHRRRVAGDREPERQGRRHQRRHADHQGARNRRALHRQRCGLRHQGQPHGRGLPGQRDRVEPGGAVDVHVERFGRRPRHLARDCQRLCRGCQRRHDRGGRVCADRRD